MIKYKGVIVVETIPKTKIYFESKYLKRWYNILCNTTEREKEFENFFIEGEWMFPALYKYRQHQISCQRGQGIIAEELTKIKKDNQLIFMLEEVFLYPISKATIKLMKETFLDYNYLLELHRTYKDYTLEKLISDYRNDFIK